MLIYVYIWYICLQGSSKYVALIFQKSYWILLETLLCRLLCAFLWHLHSFTEVHIDDSTYLYCFSIFFPLLQLLVRRLHYASRTETEEEPNHEHDVVAEVRQSVREENDKRENMRLKLEHMDFRNDENKTPLHLAAMSGNVEWVARLLE